ncbi:MAG: MBL fold metallo-hydrolase [Oscillospiraceae bacterium]|nr:MBL fold metallo-hydrolase [Oscillospiraceae bacterium]MBQ7130291.1 MBL fold metallo-hydrolase [Oscillospiraceae bacterium]
MYRHEVTEFAPKTWCLSEFKLVNAFLVEGTEKAALIDTGCGIGNLAQIVRELTQKPLIILMTHGHFDHDGGVKQFPGVPVYLHEADGQLMHKTVAMMQKMMGTADLNKMRSLYITTRGPVRCPELDVNELLKLVPDEPSDPIYEWLPMEDGMTFDLGERVLKVIHTPGHTPGEVSILDETSRTLFSGDTANVGIILMRQPNNGTALIEECNRTMGKLWSMEVCYDRLGVGHDAVTISKQIIKDYYDLTCGLLDGSIVGTYEETGFRKGDVARLGMAELWYQCDA